MKRNQIIHTVIWDEYAMGSYLYGTELDVTNPYKVKFHNTLIPSGTVIKEWSSKTSYWGQRIEPQLPLVFEGKTYYVKFNCKTVPERKVFLRINFYDRQGNIVEFKMMNEKNGSFTVPKKTVAYDMQLIQAGAESLTFKSIQFSDEPFKEELFNPKKDEPLTLLFVEPIGRSMTLPNFDRFKQLSNLLYIYDYYPEVKELPFKKEKWKKIRCVGYGTLSNQNAKRIADQLGVLAFTSQPIEDAFVYTNKKINNVFQNIIDSSYILNDYVDYVKGVR